LSTPIQAAGGASDSGEPREISLYEKWKKIQPNWVKGYFQRLRRIALSFLVAFFYIGPWLRWEGRPAIWFNLPERKFVIFDITFWPQDFVLLAWLLVIAAFSLFFFTVVAGRLWCGFACPQTVWTLCYVWIERKVEGERNQRIKLDASPWSSTKLRKKGLKYLLWSVVAFSISITFVGFFTPILELLPKIVHGELSTWESRVILFLAGCSLLFSGVLREQVCLHMCPYARFQSVLFDRDTLIVSYDTGRGEPRGGRSRRSDPGQDGLGSCVDCKLCVSACPTGIDIRNGLQYECIDCAACVDACNGVMKKMGYAPNLIRYSSENQDEGKIRTGPRKRVVAYAAILVAMVSSFAFSIATRVPLEMDIIRDRNRLYREIWDGSVENTYTLRIMNMEQEPRSYSIRVERAGTDAGKKDGPLQISGRQRVEIAAGHQLSLAIGVTAGADEMAEANTDVVFTVEALGEPVYRVTETSRFLRPPKSSDP